METSVYINITDSTRSWIIGAIAGDIQNELKSKGMQCDVGNGNNYNNHEVCFHMSYAYAKPNHAC